jgi:hypothetical protein
MARYWAAIDGDGRATGFYSDALHGAPPGGAIEISEETWRAWTDDTERQRWDGAALVSCDPPLERLREELTSAARAALATRISAGMPWSGRVLQIDEASQGRLSAAVLMAQYGLPEGFAWRMADNTAVPMQAAALVAMARAAGAYVAALRARYWALADAIAAAADAASLHALDLAAGWPAPPEG